MPWRWYSGNTETGPRPYQFGLPSETVTGEKATCPTTRPSSSATSDTVSALAARSSMMMNCSVLLLISSVLNAATGTSAIASISDSVSLLMSISCLMLPGPSFTLANVWGTCRYGA